MLDPHTWQGLHGVIWQRDWNHIYSGIVGSNALRKLPRRQLNSHQKPHTSQKQGWQEDHQQCFPYAPPTYMPPSGHRAVSRADDTIVRKIEIE